MEYRWIYLAMALGMAWSSQTVAGFYKWVDEAGVVHYSEKAPASVESKAITVKKAPESDGYLKEQTRRMQQMQERMGEDRQRRTAEKQQKEAEKEQSEARCKQAKSEMHDYQDNGRIYYNNENGERVYLDDKTIAQRLAQARKAVKQLCEK